MFHARDTLIKGYRSVCGMHHNCEDWMSRLKMSENLNLFVHVCSAILGHIRYFINKHANNARQNVTAVFFFS